MLGKIVDDIITLITGVAPAIAVVLAASLTPWIAEKNEQRKLKDSILKERYEKLYLPFIDKTIKYQSDYSELVLNAGVRQDFLNILLPNIKYMGEESFAFISDLYHIHLELTSYENLSYEEMNLHTDLHKKDVDHYLEIFKRTTKSLLKEASSISQKLSMPDIASSVEFL